MPKNPSAFPARNFIVPKDCDPATIHELGATQGMTLRDYFAAKAMQGIVSGTATSRYGGELPGPVQVASDAYEYADAMLEARDDLAVQMAPYAHAD